MAVDREIAKLLSTVDQLPWKKSSFVSELRNIQEKLNDKICKQNSENRTLECENCIGGNVRYYTFNFHFGSDNYFKRIVLHCKKTK